MTLSSTSPDRNLEPLGSTNTEVKMPCSEASSGDAIPSGGVTTHEPVSAGWHGEHDPARPINWTRSKKWTHVTIIAAITLLSPLASSVVAPAVPLVLQEFDTKSNTVGSFIVSIYVLGFALGLLVLAPMSEIYGRLPLYHACNAIFLLATIVCALSPNTIALLVFRLLADLAGSCPLTLGRGTIADLTVSRVT